MKFLVFGSNGQVGKELSSQLAPLGELVCAQRCDVELTHTKNLQNYLHAVRPDIILNAAAYTAVDRAETEEETAHLVNHIAVATMSDYAKSNDSLLFTYSTDYVFDGAKLTSYTEKDNTNPLNVYGKSKVAGEQALINSSCRGYVFRTSWVYSQQGANFLNTILRLAKTHESLSVVNDQIGAPTSANLIARFTVEAIKAAVKGDFLPGIYHLTAQQSTSWYELAQYLLRPDVVSHLDLSLHASQLRPIPTEGIPLPAMRPKNSRLNVSKIENMLGLQLPHWSEDVDYFIEQVLKSDVIT